MPITAYPCCKVSFRFHAPTRASLIGAPGRDEDDDYFKWWWLVNVGGWWIRLRVWWGIGLGGQRGLLNNSTVLRDQKLWLSQSFPLHGQQFNRRLLRRTGSSWFTLLRSTANGALFSAVNNGLQNPAANKLILMTNAYCWNEYVCLSNVRYQPLTGPLTTITTFLSTLKFSTPQPLPSMNYHCQPLA